MFSFFAIGAAIGAVTGLPIGPVNVAVIDSAYRHNLRKAIGVAFGGATADFVYAMLGIVGVSPLLVAHPIVPPILYALSGLALIGYGILTVRSQAVDPSVVSSPAVENKAFWSGFWLGAALIFLNPATLVTWVVIVGSFFAGTNFIEGTAAAIGIGVGSAAWFVFVAYLADHGRRILGAKAIWITRGVGVGLVGFGLFSLGRAIYVFWQM